MRVVIQRIDIKLTIAHLYEHVNASPLFFMVFLLLTIVELRSLLKKTISCFQTLLLAGRNAISIRFLFNFKQESFITIPHLSILEQKFTYKLRGSVQACQLTLN